MPHFSAAAAATKKETKQLGNGKKIRRTKDNKNSLQWNLKREKLNSSFNNVDFIHYETYSASNACPKQGNGEKHCLSKT